MADNKVFNIISPPSELSDKEKILSRAYTDLIYFGRAFLPNDFLNKSQSPEFHHIIGKKLITTKPGARLCNILPRGFGKSILAKAAIMHKICFSTETERNFIAWVAEEQGQAVDHIKYIRNHLESNKAIQYYFGSLAGDLVGKRWTEKDLVTSKGDRIMAKGTSQRLRGRTEIDVRYTGIILDDFESELNTKTPERRSEIKKWVVSTVYPALEESPGREGWIWLCGTIVHFDSFLQTIVEGYNDAIENKNKYPWDLNFYRAIENEKPLWAEQFPLKKLDRKKAEFAEMGMLNKFAQEYMNDARDLSSASFKIDNIQFHNAVFVKKDNYTYLNIKDETIPVNIFIGVDIAATATSSSDFQAIVVLAIDSDKNRYVLEYFRERIPTFDLPEIIIKYANKYAPVRRVNIETVAAQEMVRDMTTRLAGADRRLMPGIFKGVKPPNRIKKQDRLETALGTIVNSKRLYLRKTMTELIDELFEHPVSRNDDLMDALYYADYFGRPPISSRFKTGDTDVIGKIKKTFKSYNWLTGAKS